MSNSIDYRDKISLADIAARLGVHHPHQVDQVGDSLEQVRRIATQLRDKMDSILRALDTPNVEFQLYTVRQIADHAGYFAANTADLMCECGRVDAAVQAWVRDRDFRTG